MSDIQNKMKRWIELIKTEKLRDVIKDIQNAKDDKMNDIENKNIFKLLLYLAHTADKCNRKKHEIGKDIFELTYLLCSMLTDIPDVDKLFSSIFHISRCLLTLDLYEETAKICFYLNSDELNKLGVSSEQNNSEVPLRITYLWRNVVNNVLQTLQSGSANYSKFKTLIVYELNVIQIIHKNYTKPLLMEIDTYLEKIATIDKKLNKYFNDFSKYIMKYLNSVKISLDNEEKYTIYCNILHIISRIVCENTTENCIQSAVKVLNDTCRYFENVLSENEECYQCFCQYKNICSILLRPAEELTDKSSKDMQYYINNYVKTIKKYGYAQAVKWTALSVAQILEPLLIYWEKCLKTGVKQILTNGILLKTMNLVTYISTVFTKQTSNKCKSCQDKECMIRRDIYNAVVIKTRCINVISKLPAKDLAKDICISARKFLEENIMFIHEMKQHKCKCWTYLWCTSGTQIYNLGITSEDFYEESTLLFSLLCSCIIRFEGVYSKNRHLNLQNPICSTLHRLSSVHYNHGMYREAMTASALNGLLSYNDPNSKAFRMWANIKHKCASEKMMDLTMLACLRADENKIGEIGLQIKLSEYDLVQICLCEAKGLQEAKCNLSRAIQAVIDELRILNATTLQRSYAIQLLGYHSLYLEHDNGTVEYITEAISNLKGNKNNLSLSIPLYLEANLEFFTFITELYSMNRQTQIEMESTKFALNAPRSSEAKENEYHDVVPAYTMINVKENSRLMSYLCKTVNKWNEYFKCNLTEIINGWEPTLTLNILIIAGEYARLYRYENCEIDIWKLAYKLASDLQDYRTIIYVTGRSISLRQINDEWIAIAEKHAMNLKSSTNEDITYAIAIFWISLADFYFDCGMFAEARKLLNEARALPGISFSSNISVYLYSLDTIVRNCTLYNKDATHEEYSLYIVESLYTMVNLSEELFTKKWRCQRRYLFGLDILFSSTVNFSLRMNSLLSFREISAHLIRRLKTAQALGATMRVAELLKCLCFIDLSRSQLDNCEVKLQGLEHILNIETFQLSMNTKLKHIKENLAMTPIRVIDPVRDILQNDTSPILRHKVFNLPKFITHTNCDCYMCQNTSYRYLVFASTYIRAQLYVLQNNVTAALQHFHGAFKIKQKLFNTKKPVSVEIFQQDNRVSCWQDYFYAADYVLLLLDFYYFLKDYMLSKQQQTINIPLMAIDICETYKLRNHPIYMAVEELIIDESFQSIFNESDCLEFTVPHANNINVRKYVQETTIDQSLCFTPTGNTCIKKPLSVRRNRTPPFFKFTKLKMELNDDEEINSVSPTISMEHKKSKSKPRSQLVRRKIFEDDEPEESNDVVNEMPIRNKSVLSESKNFKKADTDNTLIKDIVFKVAPLIPDITEELYKLTDNFDEPATNENLEKLIGMVENIKINSSHQKTEKKVRNTCQSKSLSINEQKKKINQAVELFKNMIINERSDELLQQKNPIRENIESLKEILPTKTDMISSKKKEGNSSKVEKSHTNETKVVRRSARRIITEEVSVISTRSSLRLSKEKRV